MADESKIVISGDSRNINYVNRAKAEATRKIPVVRVTFHTDDGCYQALGTTIDPSATQVPDPTYQVQSVTTQKSLHSPAGAFVITLAGDMWVKDKLSGGKPGKKLRANDLVIISMGYKGDKVLDTVMVGLIDRVECTKSISGNEPSVTTTITGRDFGKVFLKGTLKFYPRLKGQNELDPATKPFFLKDFAQETFYNTFFPKNEKGDGKNIVGDIPTVADRIMRFIVQKLYDVSWSVYDTAGQTPVKKTAQLGNILRYVFGEFDNYFLPVNPAIVTYEGAVWNLLERILIKPFGELFVDTRDADEAFDGTNVVVKNPKEYSSQAKGDLKDEEGRYPAPSVQFGDDQAKVCLFLRKTPFSSDLWNSLKTHELTDLDVVEESLGYGDNEHYNLFFVGSRIAPGNIALDQQKKVFPPIFTDDNQTKARRYGLSPLEVDLQAVELDASKEEKPEDAAFKLKDFAQPSMQKLADWFGKNEEMTNGTLGVRGKGSYKVGQVLSYTTTGMDFYMENIEQDFHMYQGWKSKLGVTRGYDKTKRFPTEE